MKQDIQLSVLPSVQAFLIEENEQDRSMLQYHCNELKTVYMNLGMLRAADGVLSNSSEILENAMLFCSNLYYDLEQICKEVEEYCK